MTPRLCAGDAKQVMVRMDPAMHQAIKDRAAAEERTMAQTIRHAVRRYLETEPSP